MRQRSPSIATIWIAIIAVLMHSLIPLASTARGEVRLVTAFCSVHGGKQAPITISIPGKPAPDQGAKCPLCLAGAHFALAANASPSAWHAEQFAHRLVATPASPKFALIRWQLFAPRAPPLA